MAIDPFLGSIGAAGISSAFDLVGGALSRPKHSQRDLMHMQYEFWERQAKRRHQYQVQDLRKAGLNPILAVSQPPPAAQGISAPQPYTDPMGAAVSKAGSSALSSFMAMHQRRQINADTELKEAQAVSAKAQARLQDEQAATERERPALVRGQTAEHVAGALNKQQQARLSVLDSELRKLDIKVRDREAVVAEIYAGLWREGERTVRHVLNELNLDRGAVNTVTKALGELRRLDRSARDALGRAGEGLSRFGEELPWWLTGPGILRRFSQ